MALIAMVTATESLKENIRVEFSSLGTNTFSIQLKRSGGFRQGRREAPSDPITYLEAKRLSAALEGTEITVSKSINASMIGIASKGNERTNPNVQILGVDEHYLNVSNITLEKGRGFSETEAEGGEPVIVIGSPAILCFAKVLITKA